MCLIAVVNDIVLQANYQGIIKHIMQSKMVRVVCTERKRFYNFRKLQRKLLHHLKGDDYQIQTERGSLFPACFSISCWNTM